MWYVKAFKELSEKINIEDFILTKWYVNELFQLIYIFYFR